MISFKLLHSNSLHTLLIELLKDQDINDGLTRLGICREHTINMPKVVRKVVRRVPSPRLQLSWAVLFLFSAALSLALLYL